MTVREVAERLKITPHTVRRWIRDGALRASKVGRKEWRIREEEVDRLVGTQHKTAASEWVDRILALRAESGAKLTSEEIDELIAETRRELENRVAGDRA